MTTDLSQSSAPYNDPAWLALDRARRALDQAREVAVRSSGSHSGDAAAIIRSAANFLLQRAAEYSSEKPPRCPQCDDADLVHRIAWVDARTLEFVELPGLDDLGTEMVFYCGRCEVHWYADEIEAP